MLPRNLKFDLRPRLQNPVAQPPGIFESHARQEPFPARIAGPGTLCAHNMASAIERHAGLPNRLSVIDANLFRWKFYSLKACT